MWNRQASRPDKLGQEAVKEAVKEPGKEEQQRSQCELKECEQPKHAVSLRVSTKRGQHVQMHDTASSIKKQSNICVSKTIHLTTLSQKQSCLAQSVPSDLCVQVQHMRKTPLLAMLLQCRQRVLCSVLLQTKHDGQAIQLIGNDQA